MAKKTIEVRLVDADLIQGASYNPRQADPERLKALTTSLDTFGWLMPAYANENNTLLSGHQRTKVWRELGNTQVPVVTITGLDDKKQRSVNILFNLATNDMDRNVMSEQLWEQFTDKKLVKATNKFQCQNIVYKTREDLAPLVDMSVDGWQYAKSMYALGIVLPIVFGRDGKIANGSKRLVYYLKRNIEKIPCVVSEEHTADEISGYLNFISMNFAIRQTYEKEIKYGAYRRPRLRRTHFGMGFQTWVMFKEPKDTKAFDHTDPKTQKQLRERFGTHVIDFGAGHLHESKMLEVAGLKAYPFEPYHIPRGQTKPSLEKSRELTKTFLDNIARGQKFDSCVLSSVFNSVPFIEDRRNILTILSALEAPIYLAAMSRHRSQYKVVTDVAASKAFEEASQMKADYEDGVIIGELSTGHPKAQKFHNLAELKDLVGEYYNEVKGFTPGLTVYVMGKNPKPVNRDNLIKACKEEFDLPYPDGESIGLGEYAVEAFIKRGIL